MTQEVLARFAALLIVLGYSLATAEAVRDVLRSARGRIRDTHSAFDGKPARIRNSRRVEDAVQQ